MLAVQLPAILPEAGESARIRARVGQSRGRACAKAVSFGKSGEGVRECDSLRLNQSYYSLG